MVHPDWHYTVENSILSFFYMKGIRSLLVEKEFHTFHEILYMYNIDATLITEKDNIQVKSGDLVIIPKETFHQFILQDPDSYWRSCFHLTGIESVPELSNLVDSCADEVRILNAPQLSALLDSIPAALDDFYTDGEKSMYINSLFVQMLLEVKRNLKFSTSLKSRDRGSLVYRTLNYINENYRKHVDLDTIAVSLSVSSSTLSHQFKKELNISPKSYRDLYKIVL